MQVNEAKNNIIHHVLDTERDEFHREWVPENLKGIALKEAYEKSKEHILIVAVIAIYGVKKYKDVVRIRWKEVNKKKGY